jgi:hypothetical protein
VITTFTCQKSFIDLNDETDFFVDASIEDGTIVKVITSNGISAYEKYRELI